ncbi:MAG: MerR family transcriptional regulator [Burkholderiaceae bacterium]|nr:MerR family transcriptional regulator [Burkholderiaceae bacterium]
MDKALPSIPAKRYFTIGEVSELCGVKPYVLRYWEQEFTQLKPMKRRGNRRYYQHHEVLLIRRIRDLLYDQGFTISGARNQLGDGAPTKSDAAAQAFHEEALAAQDFEQDDETAYTAAMAAHVSGHAHLSVGLDKLSLDQVREELLAIRASLLA